MSATLDYQAVATAKFSLHAAANGNGGIVSTHPRSTAQEKSGDRGTGDRRTSRRRYIATIARNFLARGTERVTDRLVRITTALAVLVVTDDAEISSYQHAYQLANTHFACARWVSQLPTAF
jgi:hypothetical protein